MLIQAERIELAILTLLVEHPDESGWVGYRGNLEEVVKLSGTIASTAEILEELILLHREHLVAIARYESADWVPYDPQNGTRYFYEADFRCTCLPGARRRQQELAKGKRNGIFVSHFGPESPVAVHLKKFICAALTPEVPVFVSSDYDSIPSGDWYGAILDGLRRSEAIICLLSPVSIDRRWINFEAGFGFGAESEVITLVWGRLDKAGVGMPLGRLQARALIDPEDVRAMMKALATRCRIVFNESLLDAFMEALPAVQALVPSTELAVRLFRTKDGMVQLSIQNMGTRQLDMVEAELLMPEQLNRGQANWFQAWEPVTERRNFSGPEGINYVGIALTVHPANRSHQGINPLRAILTPEMGEWVVPGIGIHLPQDLSSGEIELPIYHSVQSRQVQVGPEFLPISQIPFRP
jgi:hypothetical protein